jgi:hypothetical protein
VVVVVVVIMVVPRHPVHSATPPREAVVRATNRVAERFKSTARVWKLGRSCGTAGMRVKSRRNNIAERAGFRPL